MTSFAYGSAVYDGTNASLTSAVSANGWPEIGERYRIPPRCGVAVRLYKGQLLSVENTHGMQVCDFWAYLAADMGQFLSMSHCRTRLQSASTKIGDVLVTNWRQPLLEIIEDTSPGVHDNCADSLRMALAAIGLSAPLVPDLFNLWMNIPIMPDGATSFEPTVSSAGDRFDMRALADCIAVMSACPQDKNLINGYDAMPSELYFSIGA